MEKEKFPKVSAKAKVKTITKEKDFIKVKFDKLSFSPGQYEQLSKWQDDEDELLVTIEQFQGKLPKGNMQSTVEKEQLEFDKAKKK